MELVIFLVILIGGIGFWLYMRKKNNPEKEEVEPMAALNMAVTNMTVQGKVQDRDFKVFIVSESEYSSKTPEEIKAWMGVNELPIITGKGLYEFAHNGIDIFLLIVEKTSQPVIDWKPTEIKTIALPSEGDQTEYVQKIFENLNSSIRFSSDDKVLVSGDKHGIFFIEDKENILIEGGKTHFYTTSAGTPRYEGKIEYYQRSLRKAFRYINTGGLVKNIIYSSNNDTPADKPRLPEYYVRWEFEVTHDMTGCKNLTLDGCESRHSWGDGYYIGGDSGNENIYILNCSSYWSGRLAIGIVSGKNILVDNFSGITTRRSGFNIEPNFNDSIVENVILRNSYFGCGLTAFPMGRLGRVQNILIENNEYRAGFTSIVNNSGGLRKNIIFRGNKRLNATGSPRAPYVFYNTENILIENEYNHIVAKRSRRIVELFNCKNITIRNNDFVGGIYVVLYDTDPSEVIVYGNKQEIFLQVMTVNDEDMWELKETIPAVEYDVAKYGEPDVPQDPTWEGLNNLI